MRFPVKHYLARFKKELNSLGAKHISVKIKKTRTSHGKVYHKLMITNMKKSANLQEVLSQGEYRIVTLAAFLADAGGRADSSPFIFDDPISSLDQEYEEKLVERLIDLSRTRQVIVFTHRLSLLSMLTDVSNKSSIKPTEICLRSEPWGNGEPCETSYFAKRPDKALNNLKDNRLYNANKVYHEKGQHEYNFLAKGICSDFRILVESAIEHILLSEVILRFRRNVVTKGKIEKLSKIELADCKLLDAMMTKYSKYEHSHSQETPVELPKPDEVEDDITKVIDWIKEFRIRE
jgi:ABC-type cobalamin/Fe3+-siderophores transport system ATPase subunit